MRLKRIGRHWSIKFHNDFFKAVFFIGFDF